MEWISVNDRLPEPEQAVLICVDYEQDEETEQWITKGFYENGEQEVWQSNYDFSFYDSDSKIREAWYEISHFPDKYQDIDGEVTHWMPLPELPRDCEVCE